MEKVSVQICTGTTCFVMGGANLQELMDIIPRKYGQKAEAVGCSCLKICSTELNYAKAPYVKIDGEVITEATVEKVLETIDKKLGLK